jgi:hypothetical protein
VENYSEWLDQVIDEANPADNAIAIRNSRFRGLIDSSWGFDAVAEALLLVELLNVTEVRDWARTPDRLGQLYRGCCQYRRRHVSAHTGDFTINVYRSDVLKGGRQATFSIAVDRKLLSDRLTEEIVYNQARLADLPDTLFLEYGMGPLIASLRYFVLHFGLSPELAAEWVTPLRGGWARGRASTFD